MNRFNDKCEYCKILTCNTFTVYGACYSHCFIFGYVLVTSTNYNTCSHVYYIYIF